MNLKKLLFIAFVFFSFQFLSADPPEPEIGTRWVLNNQYSDEFDGTLLNSNKWRNYFRNWKGRMPAQFVPETISVKEGYLQIENGILKKKKIHKKEAYTIKGGAVQSVNQTAHFGYYECKFKASRIAMSTTFWMSNSKEPVVGPTKKSSGIDCDLDKFSQELDICESIGGLINAGEKFRTQMNFNTHYRYVNCEGGKEKFYSKGNNAIEGNGLKTNAKLSSESWEDFHVYAAHWKNANEVTFYADDKLVGNVVVSTEVVDKPFDQPMGINMVTETYNWAMPYPTNKELNNNEINTSYYDWIRSYESIEIDKIPDLDIKSKPSAIFKEEFSFFEKVTFSTSKKSMIIPFIYKANENRILKIEVIDPTNKKVFETMINLYAGYGKDIKIINLKGFYTPEKKVVITMQSKNGLKTIKLLTI